MDNASQFPSVSENVVDHAREQAFIALRDAKTPRLLREFYDPETNYAGATFTQLGPVDHGAVTAVDLVATATLSVTIPPRAVRRFLGEEGTAQELSRLLHALPDVTLENTTLRTSLL